ncbi:hypothetical protein MPN20_05660 [Brevibacterium sp. ZH18]|nr:hypothetical protein [Brevibacterium sp. ZH18]
MEPGLGAVIFLTFAMLAVFSFGAFLVHRVMTKPGAHIGSRLPPPEDVDPGAEAGPGQTDPDAEAGPGTASNHRPDNPDR